MEKDSPESEFRKVLMETLKSLKSSKSFGNVYIETVCPEGRPVIRGHK